MANDSFSRIEISCLEGRPQSTRLRQKLFHSLHTALKSSEKTIKDAIAQDTGNNDWEVTLEYTLAISELRTHYASLDLEQDLKRQKSMEDPSGTAGVGIIYIISSKQNLFYSVISAITAALAAGNCVILELPTTLTRVSGVLRTILPPALDADVFAIVSTRISKENLSKCHVLAQDGDTSVSKSSSINSPQLGSKPSTRAVAVVDRSADISEAASIIGASKMSFNGQSAYSPDIVLVNEFVAGDFLFHLVQAITAPMRKEKEIRPKATHLVNGHADIQAQVAKELEANDGFKVIMSGKNGIIVEVKDRIQVLKGHKLDSQVVAIHQSTSLDDAIDLCNGLKTPLEASYLFAAAAEANYLSRFIDSRISCINHIPSELLVGPFAPEHPTIAPSPSPRYSLALFRSPRPRLGHASDLSIICQKSTRSRSTKQLEMWSRSIVQPALPAIKQADGKASGFFDQAFIVAGLTFISFVAGGAFALYQLTRRR